MFNTRRMKTFDWYLAWFMVFLQFSMLGLLIYTGPLMPSNIWSIIMILAGAFVGLWAIYTIRLGNLSIMPYVKEGGTMIAKGPYKYVRHPMYTGLILIAWALVIEHFTVGRAIFALLLTIALIVKLHIEETYLKKAFGLYSEYTKITRKLFPFIY